MPRSHIQLVVVTLPVIANIYSSVNHAQLIQSCVCRFCTGLSDDLWQPKSHVHDQMARLLPIILIFLLVFIYRCYMLSR